MCVPQKSESDREKNATLKKDMIGDVMINNEVREQKHIL